MNDASPSRHDKFRAYRARKRAAGLREIRIWVPDVRAPGFDAEARRQAALLDHSDDERDAATMMTALAADVWDRPD